MIIRTPAKIEKPATIAGFEVNHDIQLTHHFLDDMQLLANLLRDFKQPKQT
jgi:hypothetical protein